MNESTVPTVKASGAALLAATCLALVACRTERRVVPIAVGPVAAARGFSRYLTLDADAHRVDALVDGRVQASVHVDADGATTVERLEHGGHVATLRATADVLELAVDGVLHPLARREAGAWSVRALDPPLAEPLATLLALDVDLAVQGSAIVWGGEAYVQCTLSCTQAAACVQRDFRSTCARAADECAGCLEAAP